MPITTPSARDFNRDSSGARRAVHKGRVYITDRGRPAHVLLSIEDYRRLAGPQQSLVELLAMPGAPTRSCGPGRTRSRLPQCSSPSSRCSKSSAACCSSSGASRRKALCCAAGWTSSCCQPSKATSSPSTLPLRGVAPRCMCPIPSPVATR
ncbi:MAG: type II toxin-antitoxin system Phd/YefM family antitoxin [Burkholderiales bacterium]|nr:type II toxin-antitoxin system Phd/YefM family antitoxin [Burkholderiales bacterium]MDE2454743.1 type II toxin-antitoxin system Phd/YefM family antitoxin [Burkholderiales bacterium]